MSKKLKRKATMDFILHYFADFYPHSANEVAERMKVKESFIYGNLITLSMKNKVDKIINADGVVRFIKSA